jgi:hypothetical protein
MSCIVGDMGGRGRAAAILQGAMVKRAQGRTRHTSGLPADEPCTGCAGAGCGSSVWPLKCRLNLQLVAWKEEKVARSTPTC